jgi:energy-coupling factor transport system ATP-binding protein
MSSVVKFKNVTYTPPYSTKPILKSINLDIEEGEKIAIIGPTGSGKSTFIKLLNGIIPHLTGGKLEGDVIVDGLNTKECEVPQLSRHVGLVLDDPASQIFALSVEDDVAFGPANLGFPKEVILKNVDYALKITGIEKLRERNPNDISGGEQQLLAIAGLLAVQPKIMALDEPLCMLDPIGKKEVINALKDISDLQNTTLLITESGSDIDIICDIIDRAIFISDGKILLDGAPEEVFYSDLLPEYGVRRPQIVEFSMKIREKDAGFPVFLKKELLVDELKKKVRVKGLFDDRIEESATCSDVPIISVRNLNYVYPSGVQALKDLNFDIYRNSVVGIIGQNGSGKTTLAKNLVGLLKPTNKDASVIVDGINVPKSPTKEVIKHINYVFQNPDQQIFSDTVWEEVAFGPKMLKMPKDEIKAKVDRALEFFELTEYKDLSPMLLPRHLRKRVAICSVYVLNPKVLILDEPTTGLDSHEISKLMEKILSYREYGHTIIVISHDIATIAKYADQLIVMSEGKILLQGKPSQVLFRTEELKRADIIVPPIIEVAKEFNIKLKEFSANELYSILAKGWVGG